MMVQRTRRVWSACAVIGAVIVCCGVGSVPAWAAAAAPAGEPPYLAVRVATGLLPPVAERLPAVPRLVDPREHGGTLGRYGGTMRWLMGKPKDTRMVPYYGYARLVCYNLAYELEADILERYEVEDGRIFTFHLRKGHKWSDGAPFTAEDFRYVWQDVYNDKRIEKGPPSAMLVDGAKPTFEMIGETTVRYSWMRPNPEFLTALASTLPLVIAMPAHYAKRFHPRYAEPEKLKALLAAERVSNARALHKRKTRAIEFKDPDLPVLQAWVNTTPPPSGLFNFKRNPYFHRVDPNGRQLPYIDEVHMAIGSPALIPAKAGSGDSDLQARYVRFDDYTFLKAAERRGQIKVHLWEKSNGSHIAILPNLNATDDTWRKLLRDVRMRRALSLAIDRDAINEAIFFGMARPSGDTVLPRSPLFKPEYGRRWTRFDLAEANRLLDELGLAERSYDGIRQLPDGRRAEIILDTAGESSEQTDILALIKSTWRKVGIALFPRPTQRDLFRTRVYSGQSIMSVWSGHNNGVPGPSTSPEFLAPVSQAQLQWPDWGLYAQTNGRQGSPPDLPAAKRLAALLLDWRRATTDATRTRVWHEMLGIYADNLFTIGIVNGTKQPVVTAPNLRNVPADGVFSYDPGGYFGIYHPETFWYDTKPTPARAKEAR